MDRSNEISSGEIIQAFWAILPVGEYKLTASMWTTLYKAISVDGTNGYKIKFLVPHVSEEEVRKEACGNCDECINCVDEIEETDFNEAA